MKRAMIACAAVAVGWLLGGGAAEAQYCRGNVDCGAGWVCNQGTCVQGAGVQVGVQAGPAQGTGTVTVTGAQPVPPPPQQQPQPPPPQYAPQQQYAPQPAPQPNYVERPIWGLIGAGIGMLAGGYVANLAITGIGAAVISVNRPVLAEEFFYTGLVPVAGPWIQLGLMAVNDGGGWAPWLVIDGVLQAAGLTMIILGATLTRREAVYADLGDGVELGFTPTPGGARASLTW